MKFGMIGLGVFLLAAVAVAGWQWNERGNIQFQLEGAQGEIRQERDQNQSLAAELKKARALLETVQEENRQLKQPALVPAPETPPETDAAAPAPPPKSGLNGLMDSVRKMMQNPALKKLAKAQYRRVIEKQYAAFLAPLGWTEDQKKTFFDKLEEQFDASLEAGTGEDKEAGLKNFAGEQKKFNDELKGLLGAETYSKYQDYQKTLSYRTGVDQFREHLSLGSAPLQSGQADQLLSIVTTESQNIPLVTPKSTGASGVTPEYIQQTLDRQQKIDTRILERAQGILTPAQSAEYAQFLETQRATMKMGLEMSKSLILDKAN
jgi:hypothetical protein